MGVPSGLRVFAREGVGLTARAMSMPSATDLLGLSMAPGPLSNGMPAPSIPAAQLTLATPPEFPVPYQVSPLYLADAGPGPPGLGL